MSENLDKILKDSKRRYKINKIKRFFTLPYRACKSTILCLRFPFLYPRNRWTDKHYNNWKINDFHQKNWTKAYKYEEDKSSSDSMGKWKVIDKKLALKIKILDSIEQFLSIFHCLPSYTELDAMPKGWRKCFGIQMCKEIKKALLEDGGRKKLYNYRITQIKEKFGCLRWYDERGCEEVDKIINKYEYISYRTCIKCGKTAEYITKGWITPYCEKCIPEEQKEKSDKYFYDIDFYGWTKNKLK